MIRREQVHEGQVSLITLDRPERRNALDTEHWQALAASVQEAAAAGARAIVVTGAGTVFSAGGDLNEPDIVSLADAIEYAFSVVREVPVPVLAHVNGPAVGAGVQLAVSCDLRVADPAARFGIPAAAISLPVNPGTIDRIVALAGTGAARSMLIGGDWLPADRAHALGLVDRLGGLGSALAWAQDIAGYAPLLLGYFKARLQIGNPAESEQFDQILARVKRSEDYAESVLARKERRKPRYVGR